MASIALTTLRPVIQGAIGAAVAQIGLHLYVRNPKIFDKTLDKTPEQKLNAWTFTLLIGCAAGVALGVSAGALLVGIAIHTAMLLKERWPLGHIHFKNFRHPLPLLSDAIPDRVLAVCDLNVYSPHSRDGSPYLTAFITVEGKRIQVDLAPDCNDSVCIVSDCGSPKDLVSLPVTYSPADGLTRVEISDEIATHLAIASMTQPADLPRFVARHIKQADDRSSVANLTLYEGTLYGSFNGWERNDTWKKSDTQPTHPIELQFPANTIPPKSTTDILLLFHQDELFQVPFCKAFGKLHLQDAWGFWQEVGPDTQSTVDPAELLERLGLTTALHLETFVGSQSQRSNQEGILISSTQSQLTAWIDQTHTVGLFPTNIPLVFSAGRLEYGDYTPVRIVEQEGALVIDSRDRTKLKARLEQVDREFAH